MSPTEQRFWRKVRRGDGCWRWTGRVDQAGYGAFSVSRMRIVRAHRFAWELAGRAIPPGACVLHRCEQRTCVNPDHLFIGSAHQCERRPRRRPTQYRASAPRGEHHWTHRQAAKVPRGDRSHLSKLRAEQVLEIRALHARGRSADELAQAYGVVTATILNIVRGRTWRDLPPRRSDSEVDVTSP